MFSLNRNVWLLALLQPLVVSTGGLNSVVASILGGKLSGDPRLSTLPVAAFMTGLALFVVPGTKLQEKFGRKTVFISVSLISAVLGLLAALSIEYGSFVGFVLSCFAFGTQTAVIVQYRYAAIDSCDNQQDTTKALSLILIGGISSAIIGPELVDASNLISYFDTPYANAYLIISLFHLIAAVLLFVFYKTVSIQTKKESELSPLTLEEKDLRSLFKLAVLTAAIAYSVMAMLMTATPLAMKNELFSMSDIKTVIQAHILAMYIPSLFSAKLIKWLGIHKMLFIGVLVMIGSLTVSMISHSYYAFIICLVLLGLGWNLLFLSGATLLSQTYSYKNRFKAQGRFDLIISISQTSSVFASGIIFSFIGWSNLLVLAMGILIFLLLYSFKYIDTLPQLFCCNARLIDFLQK